MVRHGPTSFNGSVNERIRSWTDVPLSREGVRLAWDAARFFLDKPIGRVLSSDLQRTRVTAEKIAEENYVPVMTTRALRDWNVGELCGMLVKEAIPQLNYFADHQDERVPGGESFSTYIKRFEGVFEKLLLNAQANPREPVVAVTHSRNFGAAQAYLTGDKSIYKAAHSLPPGGVMAYRLEGGIWTMTPTWPGGDDPAPSSLQDLEGN